MRYRDKAIRWTEFVLPIWETKFPDDDRPRKAIEAVKSGDGAARAAAAAAAADAAAAAAAGAAAAAAYAAAGAAADAAYAAYAARAAAYAAYAIWTSGYGDFVKVRKAKLLYKNLPDIRWLNYSPEQFWDVLLESYIE